MSGLPAVFMCIMCVSDTCISQKRVSGLLGTGVRDSCKTQV